MCSPLEIRKLEEIQKLKGFREFLISGALYPDRPDFYYSNFDIDYEEVSGKLEELYVAVRQGGKNV